MNLLNMHPEGRAGKFGSVTVIHLFRDPLPGSNPSEIEDPRVFVAIAPPPGANFREPCRDQESNGGDPFPKVIALRPEDSGTLPNNG